MAHRMRCSTLFDITQTGVLNRFKPVGINDLTWAYKRNTQCNFDTILQVISLRSQPELVKAPSKVKLSAEDHDMFGFLYHTDNEIASYYWQFEYEIQHSSVFENGITKYGALYEDCKSVPMIICDTNIINLPPVLDISVELKNIHFEEL
jgi:hypothetical protein